MESNTQQVTTTKATALVARVRWPRIIERSRDRYKSVPLASEFGVLDRMRLVSISTQVEGHALAKERHIKLARKHEQKEAEAASSLVKLAARATVLKETGKLVDEADKQLERSINEAIESAMVPA